MMDVVISDTESPSDSSRSSSSEETYGFVLNIKL